MNAQRLIVPVVEGYGEVEALPVLFRKLQSTGQLYRIGFRKPIRVKRYQVVREGEWERTLFLARSQPNAAGVIALFDADNDCPVDFASSLRKRAIAIGFPLPLSIVIAQREFESWFLAGVESLRGFRGIRGEALPPEHPETIRGAKEWLQNHMEPGRTYLETRDQAALCERLDLDMARTRARSLDKLIREFEWQCAQADSQGA